jgi:hypothetical protein
MVVDTRTRHKITLAVVPNGEVAAVAFHSELALATRNIDKLILDLHWQRPWHST